MTAKYSIHSFSVFPMIRTSRPSSHGSSAGLAAFGWVPATLPGDVGSELLLQQQTEKEPTIPDIETEIEIECLRYYDIMALPSDFDRLYYLCKECNLSLSITSRAVSFINYAINMKIVDHIVLYRYRILLMVYAFRSNF
jgi:hypothetical protein